jgi:hypothetical protein
MERAGFGEAKLGGGTFIKTKKVEPGINHIRILPPLGSGAATGTWRVKHAIHWGYNGVNPRDKAKKLPRPFKCILQKDYNTKMVKQDCPACTYYDQLDAKSKEMEAGFKSKGLDGDALKTAMKPMNERLRNFRLEAKWYVNVAFKDGSVGDFKLNFKDHMSRILAIVEGTKEKPGTLVQKTGIDPFKPDQGVWFEIIRTGDGVTPPDTVDLEMEALPGQMGTSRIKLAPLSDEVCAKALKECRDLDTLGGKSLTYHQIEQLVACSGDPEAVDKIFGVGQDEKSAGAVIALASAPEEEPETFAAESVQAYTVNGKTVTKEQFDRYQSIMAAKKAEADAKAKAEAEAKAKAAAEAKAKAEEAAKLALSVAAKAATASPGDDLPKVDPMQGDDASFLASLGVS